MKLSTCITFVSLLATTDAFGSQLSMRVGLRDMNRRQKFNKILSKVDENPSKVSTLLLADDTSMLIQKCNWRVRSSLLRKVKDLAEANGVEMDASFGVAKTQKEREHDEYLAKLVSKAQREAARKAHAEEEQKKAVARAQKKILMAEKAKESYARAEEAKKNTKA